MDWIQVGSLAALIIGTAAWIYSLIRTLETRLDTHIVAINERVDAANARTDAANQRTDELISILIDHVRKPHS